MSGTFPAAVLQGAIPGVCLKTLVECSPVAHRCRSTLSSDTAILIGAGYKRESCASFHGDCKKVLLCIQLNIMQQY